MWSNSFEAKLYKELACLGKGLGWLKIEPVHVNLDTLTLKLDEHKLFVVVFNLHNAIFIRNFAIWWVSECDFAARTDIEVSIYNTKYPYLMKNASWIQRCIKYCASLNA